MDLKFWELKPILEDIPGEIYEMIEEVKRTNSQREALEKAYALLSERYHGLRGQTYLRIWQLFRKPEQVLRTQAGFLHCTHMNYVLITVLVKSGWFKEDDFKMKWTVVFGFSPHQYIEVQIDEEKIPVDLWGASYGLKVGQYAHWFKVGRLW